MRLLRNASLILLTALLCACHKGPDKPELPKMLIDERGLVMPLSEAVGHIAFRPYLPPGAIKYAAIPPLGGDDVTANDGIAVEYAAGRSAMLLSEWPRHNFPVKFNNKPLREPCTLIQYAPNSFAWLTGKNVVMTLQPDGKVPPAEVSVEAKHLLAAGACR